jgi:hypothetical protein
LTQILLYWPLSYKIHNSALQSGSLVWKSYTKRQIHIWPPALHPKSPVNMAWGRRPTLT